VLPDRERRAERDLVLPERDQTGTDLEDLAEDLEDLADPEAVAVNLGAERVRWGKMPCLNSF